MIQPHEDRILYLPGHAPQVNLSFHLDENISHVVAGRLRDNGFDVTTTEKAGLRSTSDRTQMDYALRQQRVIVTRDRDFVQLHHDQYPHSGIVYWPHGRVTSSPQMLELLVRFHRDLRRHDHRVLRQIQDETGAEIVLETSSTVRLFSDSLKSLDDAAVRLRDTVPWTCEAVVRVDRAGFRRWVLAEFAGAKRFGDQMQVRVGWDHLGRLVVNGVANSLVENALDTIAAAVPVLEVCEFLRSYVEPTRRYGRQSRRVENLGSLGHLRSGSENRHRSMEPGKLVQKRLPLEW